MHRPMVAVLLTCAVLIGFLLCLPVFREGLGIAEALVLNTVRDPRDFGLSEAKLEQLSGAAERDRNANLMASLALRSGGEAAIVRAQRAVAFDKNLTWTYSIVCENYPDGSSAACGQMIQQLQAWDPDNSVPYLLEARRIEILRDPKVRNPRAAVADPAWRQAMEKAFSAPHYDAYEDRLAAMNRNLYAVLRAYSLSDFNDGLLLSLRIPDFDPVRGFMPEALQRDPEMVIDFAHRVQAGSETSIERALAASWLQKAYEAQNRRKPGSVSALQIAAETKLSNTNALHEQNLFPLLDPLARTFQLVVLVQVLSLVALTILCMLVSLRRLWHRTSSYLLQLSISASAVALGSSSVAMLLLYRPYSALAHGLVEGSIPSASLEPWIFASLYHPVFWDGFVPFLWTALLVFCGIALVIVGSRALASRQQSAH